MLLAAILVVGLGFGSAVRASALADNRAQSVEMAAYVLPDGSMPVICRGGLSDDHAPSHAAELHCFVCAFAKIAGLPPAPDRPLAARSRALKPRLALEKSAPVSSSPKAFFARGPPIRI